MFLRNTDISEEHELSDTDSHKSIYTLNVTGSCPVRGQYHYEFIHLTQGNTKYE